MRSILLNLNTADDYFKVKKKVEELERELSEKDQEIYEFKHEMITAQIRLENAEKRQRHSKSEMHSCKRSLSGWKHKETHKSHGCNY